MTKILPFYIPTPENREAQAQLDSITQGTGYLDCISFTGDKITRLDLSIGQGPLLWVAHNGNVESYPATDLLWIINRVYMRDTYLYLLPHAEADTARCAFAQLISSVNLLLKDTHEAKQAFNCLPHTQGRVAALSGHDTEAQNPHAYLTMVSESQTRLLVWGTKDTDPNPLATQSGDYYRHHLNLTPQEIVETLTLALGA